MTFRNLIKFDDKIGSRGCKWIRLNAPRTKMPEWHSEVKENLRTKLALEAANGSVWMPLELKFPWPLKINLVSSIYPIYWPISTIITQMVVQQIMFPLFTLLTVHYPHPSTIPMTLQILFPLSTLFTDQSQQSSPKW